MTDAEPTPSAPSTPGTELRIALAMRGGVSLAVWIGGVLAELDLARRGMLGEQALADLDDEEERVRGRAYAGMLRTQGYDSLKIDVLAGASAGGLNAAIYGYAQTVGIGIDWLREVWLDHGDLWGLFHPQWSAGAPFRTPSLLQGDERFYQVIHRELDDRKIRGVALLQTPVLTVDLAATLQSGPPLPSSSDGGDVRPRTAHFRFRRTPAPLGPLNDLHAPSDSDDVPAAEAVQSLYRLAYAARATSSFPGAFEPAAVMSREPDDPRRSREPSQVAAGDGAAPLPSNMASVFSEMGTAVDGDFEVIDGGVFDNIPIGRAVDAIADAPATGPTRRVLLYLDPSPPPPVPVPVRASAFRDGVRLMTSRFVRTTLTALGQKFRAESANDDLAALRRQREAAAGDLARKDRFFATLSVSGQDAATEEDYHLLRSRSDTLRVVDLLLNPGVGFLRALVPQPPLRRGFTEQEGAVLAEHLTNRLADSNGLVDRDPTALLGASDLLLARVRRLEDGVDDGFSADLGEIKSSLFRLRTAAQCFEQLADRAVVCCVADQDLPELADDIAELMRRADTGAGTSGSTALTSAIRGAGVGPGAVEYWTALDDVVRNAGTFDLHADGLWSVAEGLRVELFPGAEPVAELSTLVMRYAVVVGPRAAATVPEFDTVTGDERPTVPLPHVRDEGIGQALDAWVARPPSEGGDRVELEELLESVVHARSKLAGNQLANFAGFLAKEWRQHDWDWGRADGAAGLTRVLMEVPPAVLPDGTPHSAGEDIKALGIAWAKVDALTASLDRPKPRLGDLGASRRYALVARSALGLQRALWPLTPARHRNVAESWASRAPLVAALMLARPVLVLLPLFIHPPLLALVVLSALAGEQVLGPRSWLSGAPPGVGTAAVLVALAGLGVAIVWARNARHLTRWRLLRAASRRASGGRDAARAATAADRVGASLRFAQWALCGLALLVFASLVGVFWLAVVSEPLPSRLTSAAAVVLLGAVLGLAFRSRGTTAVRALADDWQPPGEGSPTERERWRWLLAVAVPAAVLVGWWLLDEATWWGTGTQGVVAGLTVWTVQHAWATRGFRLGTSSVSALVAGVVVHVLGPGAPTWTLHPFAQFLVPVAVVGGVFVCALGARRLPRPVAAVVLLLAAAVAVGAWYLVWPALTAVPIALALGAAMAAAVTLVAPFVDSIDGAPPS